jgi:hypothetical protein
MTPLGLDDIRRITAFTAEAPCPQALLEAVGEVLRRHLGAKGFTLFRYVDDNDVVERIHSSDPVAYPVGGRKRAADYPQNQSVLARGEVYIARDADDIRATYRDAELIFSIGVTSIMNVPIRFCGRNLGAVNVMGIAGQFGDPESDQGRVLAALMVPALLAWDVGGGGT